VFVPLVKLGGFSVWIRIQEPIECGSRMFYREYWIRIRPFSHSGSEHFFLPGSYMKSGMQTFFLVSYAFRSKVLVLVIIKKIRDSRSGIRKKFIPDPDPGGKGSPNSRTLIRIRSTDRKIAFGRYRSAGMSLP
jgi:hypothetical protein